MCVQWNYLRVKRDTQVFPCTYTMRLVPSLNLPLCLQTIFLVCEPTDTVDHAKSKLSQIIGNDTQVLAPVE